MPVSFFVCVLAVSFLTSLGITVSLFYSLFFFLGVRALFRGYLFTPGFAIGWLQPPLLSIHTHTHTEHLKRKKKERTVEKADEVQRCFTVFILSSFFFFHI